MLDGVESDRVLSSLIDPVIETLAELGRHDVVRNVVMLASRALQHAAAVDQDPAVMDTDTRRMLTSVLLSRMVRPVAVADVCELIRLDRVLLDAHMFAVCQRAALASPDPGFVAPDVGPQSALMRVHLEAADMFRQWLAGGTVTSPEVADVMGRLVQPHRRTDRRRVLVGGVVGEGSPTVFAAAVAAVRPERRVVRAADGCVVAVADVDVCVGDVELLEASILVDGWEGTVSDPQVRTFVQLAVDLHECEQRNHVQASVNAVPGRPVSQMMWVSDLWAAAVALHA
jgi:hypothetical protein